MWLGSPSSKRKPFSPSDHARRRLCERGFLSSMRSLFHSQKRVCFCLLYMPALTIALRLQKVFRTEDILGVKHSDIHRICRRMVDRAKIQGHGLAVVSYLESSERIARVHWKAWQPYFCLKPLDFHEQRNKFVLFETTLASGLVFHGAERGSHE